MYRLRKIISVLMIVLILLTSMHFKTSAEVEDGEAYAVLQDNGDLVFFRSFNTYEDYTYGSFIDIHNNSYEGTVFTGIESYTLHAWTNEQYKNNVKNAYVANNQIIKPIHMSMWFHGCENLVSFNSTGFDTRNVTDMTAMFHGCSSLTSLNLSNFKTSNVTNMSEMFSTGHWDYEKQKYVSSLKSLDISNFDTSNATDMRRMFFGCSSLTSLDLSNFNTSNVTKMSEMFRDCSSLTSLDLSNFNTSNVTNMKLMFSGCSSLTSLDVSNFDTSNVTDMSYMFFTGEWDNEKQKYISSLTSLDVSKFDTSNVTDMSGMFCVCLSLISLDLSNFNTSNVSDMTGIFSGCSSLKSLDINNFNTSNVTYMGSMFANCSSLTSLNLSSFDTSNVTDMGAMFYGCSSLTSLNLSNFNTSKVTDMNRMFSTGEWDNEKQKYVSSLKSLDISNFDTSNATDMRRMFFGCSSLKSLDVSNFDTSKVTDMTAMFSGCSSLTSLDLSKYNTSNVKEIHNMFYDCSSLKSLDLSNFNTSNVTDMSWMFYNCLSLISLNINNFNTLKVTDMSYMFSNCFSLNSVKFGSKFTRRINNEYLPLGYWQNKSKGLIKSETELYNNYPSNASTWYGEWVKVGDPVESFVKRLYKLCLNRDAETEGLNYYVDRLKSGEFTAAQVVNNFFSSPEFVKAKHSNSELIRRAYLATLDRNGDKGGIAYYADKLENGVSNKHVLKGFVESPEFTNICKDYGVVRGSLELEEPRDLNYGVTSFVSRCYTKALERDFDIDGLNYYTDLILTSNNQKQTAITIASRNFFNSPEFLNKNTDDPKFIRICYRTFLGREAESNGLKYYIEQLNSGVSRDTVLQGFANSPEFANIMASYGIK